MIAYLEGKIIKKEEDRIILLVNHVGYEILLPANVLETMGSRGDDETTSLYIYYHQTERQPKPTLIGFNLEAEKEFFQYFISVEAIGPMKAVKAMTLPAREIARAIENKDVITLQKLDGIGKRTAQKIIATLEGKMGKFALIHPGESIEKPVQLGDFTDMVLDVLVTQLGHRAPDARTMIAEAFERNPSIGTPEDLFDEVYRGEKNL
ncbi:MAG: Holliday junction DNA helicase RuvA [Proteobacteria bacterium]|nr:Holliday junction DNA helicase RuvA [Pseudomonadota bacterium]